MAIKNLEEIIKNYRVELKESKKKLKTNEEVLQGTDPHLLTHLTTYSLTLTLSLTHKRPRRRTNGYLTS